jgi:tetratricopeptide (TPR) repeat protein
MREDAAFYYQRAQRRLTEEYDGSGYWADLSEAMRLAPENLDYLWEAIEFGFPNWDEDWSAVERFIALADDTDARKADAYWRMLDQYEFDDLENLDRRLSIIDWIIDHGFGGFEHYLMRGKQRAYFMNRGDSWYQKAIEDLTIAASVKPDDPKPYYTRAIAYQELGYQNGKEYLDEQIVDFTRYIDAKKANGSELYAQDYLIRGMRYYHAGRYDEAAADYRECLALNPTDKNAARYLREIEEMGGQK